jgi:5'-AMP-activated protein kinase regulatory gamma subunit
MASATKRPRVEFQTNPEFIQQMLTTRAETLVPPDGRIFIAERTHKVTDVWKGLIKHNFMSVPVLQKTKNKWYGFLDLADIVKYVIDTFGFEKLGKDVDFFEMYDKEEFWKTRTVNDVMTFRIAGRNPFHPVKKGYSLYFVFEMMANEKGMNRVPVLDENNNLANLITNSQMLRYVHSHMKQLGGVKDKPISQFTMPHNEVICIHEEEPAHKAFTMMINKNVGGLAVIDANGKLTENISLRDLKAIQNDGRMFHRLFQTTHNFLQKVRKDFGKKERPNHPIAVKNTDTLEHAIQLCVDWGVHRIYIIDDQKKPIGVITLHDMFAEILKSM